MRVVIGICSRNSSFRVSPTTGLAPMALVARSAVSVVLVGFLVGVLSGHGDGRDKLADLISQRFDGFLHARVVRFGGRLLLKTPTGEGGRTFRGNALRESVEKRFRSLINMLRGPALVDVSSHLDGDLRINSAYG